MVLAWFIKCPFLGMLWLPALCPQAVPIAAASRARTVPPRLPGQWEAKRVWLEGCTAAVFLCHPASAVQRAGPSLTALRDSRLQHAILRKVTTQSRAHFILPNSPSCQWHLYHRTAVTCCSLSGSWSVPRGQDLLEGWPGWRAGHVMTVAVSRQQRAGVSGDSGGQLCSTPTASARLAPSSGSSWRA